MDLSITVLCAENFQGPDCTECSRPGFTGPNCDEIDNGVGVDYGNGECVDGIDSFSSTPPPTDLAAPPQSGSGQQALIGGVISAIAAIVLFLIVLAMFLVLLTKRRGQKLYNTVSVPPQPQTDIDSTIYSQIIDSQSIKVKNNEAYSLSTTQKIPTEGNVAYVLQIPTVDNAAYGQATSQIPTEDNVAYGQLVLHADHNRRQCGV